MSHSLNFLRDNKWLPVFVLSWLFLWCHVVSLLILAGMPDPNIFLSFGFVASVKSVSIWLTLNGFVGSAVLYALKRQSIWMGIALLLPSCCCMMLPFLIFEPVEYMHRRVHTVRLEGNDYTLSYYPVSDDGEYHFADFASAHIYVLYKCARGIIFCNEIFRQTIKGYIVDPQDPRGLYRPHELYLSTDGRSVIVTDNKRDEVYRCTPHEGDCSLR